jgi:ABC-type glycerol-3-phosphate transport system substrate-binding protein
MGSIRTFRLWAVLISCLALAVAAVGCGDSDSESSAGSAPAAGQDAGSGQPKEVGEVKGELTVWDWQYTSPGWGKALKQLDKEFEAKYPGVKVKHVGQPFGEYNTLVKSAFTSKTGPDVLMFLAGSTGVLSWTKSLEDLSDYITPEERENLVGWDVVSEDYDPEKGTYGYPYGTQGNLFYYNKELFKKAGLDPEDPPSTYDELVAAAKKLKDAGITPFGGGNKEGYSNDWWFTALWGGMATKEDAFALANGDLKWTDPKVVDAHQKYIDLVKGGYLPEAYASTPLFPDAIDDFAAGKSAIFLGLAASDASWLQFNEALGEENVGIMQPPGVTQPEPNFLPASAGTSWSVPSFSDNKDAAIAYVKFVTSATAQLTQFKVGGVVPNDKTVDVSADAPANVNTMLEQYNAAELVYPPHGLWKLDVSTAHQRELNLVVGGEKSVEDALAAIQKVQDKP